MHTQCQLISLEKYTFRTHFAARSWVTFNASAVLPQVAKAEQDKVMLAKVTHDNELRLQQKAQAAQQAKLEDQRQDNTCSESL